MPSARVRMLLVAALVVTAVLSFGIPAVAVPGPDDVLPGVGLPSGSTVVVTGTLDARADRHDVYSVPLLTGQQVIVSLSGAARTDFDLYLHSPDTTNLASSYGVSLSNGTSTSAEALSFYVENPARAGVYSIDVCAFSGSGAYTLTVSVGPYRSATALHLSSPSAVATIVAIGGSAMVFAGTLDDELGPAQGLPVRLFRSTDAGRHWYVVEGRLSDDLGAFSFRTVPDRAARYNLVAPGVISSPTVVVTVRPYIAGPYAPSVVRVGRRFRVNGYLKPLHPVGSRIVSVRFYRWTGRWAYSRTVPTRIASYADPTRSLFQIDVTLATPGLWRLIASSPADAGHLATTSGALDIQCR